MKSKHSNALANAHRLYLRRKHRNNVVTKTLSTLPRLIVVRSNQFIYAQIVDRDGKVVACANDVKVTTGTKSERALSVGKDIAQKALSAGTTKVVFDRNGYLYHGRVKNVCEGARDWGLSV
jgi:large subunit ribosomal protein L18